MPVVSIASTTSATTLLAVNSGRKAVVIQNDDANALYVLLDSGTPSATNYSFSLAEGENAIVHGYGGEVKGVWAGDGSGAARVTAW